MKDKNASNEAIKKEYLEVKRSITKDMFSECKVQREMFYEYPKLFYKYWKIIKEEEDNAKKKEGK